MAMDREALKQRLLQAEFPEEVVDDLLSSVKDDDLVRMKDMGPEEIVKALKDALDAETETPTEDNTDVGDPEDVDPTEMLTAVLSAVGDKVTAQVKEYMESISIEAEVPQLGDILSEIATLKEAMATVVENLKEVKDHIDTILASDDDRIRDVVSNMSSASKERLRLSLSDNDTITSLLERLKDKKLTQDPTPPPGGGDGFRPSIRDAQGREYASLGDMGAGKPIE